MSQMPNEIPGAVPGVRCGRPDPARLLVYHDEIWLPYFIPRRGFPRVVHVLNELSAVIYSWNQYVRLARISGAMGAGWCSRCQHG